MDKDLDLPMCDFTLVAPRFTQSTPTAVFHPLTDSTTDPQMPFFVVPPVGISDYIFHPL